MSCCPSGMEGTMPRKPAALAGGAWNRSVR